jgi:hypothetical protein
LADSKLLSILLFDTCGKRRTHVCGNFRTVATLAVEFDEKEDPLQDISSMIPDWSLEAAACHESNTNEERILQHAAKMIAICVFPNSKAEETKSKQ